MPLRQPEDVGGALLNVPHHLDSPGPPETGGVFEAAPIPPEVKQLPEQRYSSEAGYCLAPDWVKTVHEGVRS